MTTQKVVHPASNATSFLAGLIIGGTVALLFAPLSGEDARAELANRAQKGARKLQTKANEIRDLASDALETGKDRALRETQRIENAWVAGNAAYQDGAEATYPEGQA